MTPTNWTEASLAGPSFFEGLQAIGLIEDAFAMLGLVIPISEGLAFSDPAANFAEASVPLTSYSEASVSPTPWTETVV